MISTVPENGSGSNPYLSNAKEAVRRLRAGAKIVTAEYGDYAEVVTILSDTFKVSGTEGVEKAFEVLKRGDPRLIALDDAENDYPLEITVHVDELKAIDRLPYTDAGQAESIARLFVHRLRYAPGLGWLIWTGKRWRRDERRAHVQIGVVVARARQQAALQRTVDKDEGNEANRQFNDIRTALRFEGHSRLTAALSIAETDPHLTVMIDQLDGNPHLLTCNNGMVDLRTGQLYDPDPEQLCTKRNKIDYIADAPAPRWLKFLDEVFEGNVDLINYLQRVIGYALTGLTREQCFWIMYGSGRNGKGTIAWVLGQLAGEYARNANPRIFENRKESETGEELADLLGARIVVASETGDGVRLNEARIKAITGNDPISCRFLRQNRFTYIPTFKVFLLSNHKPVISGTDVGIWSRPNLIPFNVSFLGREDRGLEFKLMRELPGILAWAVQGAIQYYRDGLGKNETVRAATDAYQAEMDLLAQWIEDSLTVPAPGVRANCRETFNNWSQWAEANGLAAGSQPRLSRQLIERGWTKAKATAGWYWENVQINAPATNGTARKNLDFSEL